MSVIRVDAPEDGSVPLRLKLKLSENERERLINQLDAQANLHRRQHAWVWLNGWLWGVVTTLTVLALVGALR